MAGTPEEDVTAAHNIFWLKAPGHFFEQSRGTIPEDDKDFVKNILLDALHHQVLQDDSRRGIKKCCPIISGGLNPTLLKPFIDVMWNTDFITTMWAGCHAHPGGTQKGATALVQSCEAFKKGIDIHEYAKDHEELAEALEFFEKKGNKEVRHAERTESN
jgi:ribulose-bisphosphate carboxylase large chain